MYGSCRSSFCIGNSRATDALHFRRDGNAATDGDKLVHAVEKGESVPNLQVKVSLGDINATARG